MPLSLRARIAIHQRFPETWKPTETWICFCQVTDADASLGALRRIVLLVISTFDIPNLTPFFYSLSHCRRNLFSHRKFTASLHKFHDSKLGSVDHLSIIMPTGRKNIPYIWPLSSLTSHSNTGPQCNAKFYARLKCRTDLLADLVFENRRWGFPTKTSISDAPGRSWDHYR